MRIDRPVSQRQSWWLLATALAAFLPLTPQLPLPLAYAAAGVMLLRGLISWRQWHLPPRWLLTLITIAGAGAVLWHYRTIFGRTPGIALLSVFLALKLLELRAARDALALVLLAYFLVLANFMFTQTIAAGAIALCTVVITTASLAAASDDRPPALSQLRRAAIMLAQGIPFMLVLFLLFPRVEGPLWGLPQDRHGATSGLSDTMSPGSIAQMSQSDEIAFRVSFEGPIPAQPDLYWRGPVMPLFDGRTWRTSQTIPLHRQPPYLVSADSSVVVKYELTLEPHGKQWLFALELPTTLPSGSAMTRDLQILSPQPLRTRQRYTLASIPGTLHGTDANQSELQEALALPRGGNPRTRQLGEEWRTQAEDLANKAFGDTLSVESRILARAEAFFLQQLLQYTLTPPLLGEDAIDGFLFDTRRGFCEHFAAAFVFALRAAGVPARVVAGYQGGEVNPVDNYLVVRQYDAHAWTEVWIKDRGWIRVDPTAISMPRRIADTFREAVPAGEPLPLLARADLAWLRELRHRLDAVANGWNQWVLGYNSARQRELLEKLGLEAPDWRVMTAWLAGLCGAMIVVLTGWVLWQRKHQDPARRQWLRFTRKLARRKVIWQPWEGPDDFARRAAAALPHAAAEIIAISRSYAALRYAPQTEHETLRTLQRQVRQLSI